ncbi:MAG: helix-turn-helix transcriptional regulator [Chitinophagaceae bacterium]|nr:helix-turn-helix transcriptional regulator [Chitinophagaceae bacterium]
MKLFIKNMVCPRCIMTVKQILEQQHIDYTSVLLGEVETPQTPDDEKLRQLQLAFTAVGFSLIDDRKSRVIEHIKKIIIAYARNEEGGTPTQNLSEILSAALHYDYNYLSNLFSEIEGTTIEKYLIAQKIERVKELLVYDELTLNEIAWQLGYSSTAHLSNQFKKVTGLTPSHFKQVKENKRRSLDEI